MFHQFQLFAQTLLQPSALPHGDRFPAHLGSDLLISAWAALCLWVLLPCDQFMFIQWRKTTPKAQCNIDKDYLQWWAVLNNYNLEVKNFLVAQWVKNLPVRQETWTQYLDREDHLEEEMTTHSSILLWRIPWTEEPGRLQSMGSQELDTT